MKKKKGIVIYNRDLWSETYLKHLQLYVSAGEEMGVAVTLRENLSLFSGVAEGRLVADLQDSVDFVVYLDKDIPSAMVLESMGIPVFNSSQSIGICDNKILTSIALGQKKIPQPDTFFMPLQFLARSSGENRRDFLRQVVKKLGFPLVVKEAFGSYGHQVFLVKDFQELMDVSEKIGMKPHLFQRFMASSCGKDVRVYVSGEDVVGAMFRENVHDFRANISNGGSVSPFVPTVEMEKLAIQSSLATKSLFSGVDLLFLDDGDCVVCEVNGAPHIKNYYDVFGVNLAVGFLKNILYSLE